MKPAKNIRVLESLIQSFRKTKEKDGLPGEAAELKTDKDEPATNGGATGTKKTKKTVPTPVVQDEVASKAKPAKLATKQSRKMAKQISTSKKKAGTKKAKKQEDYPEEEISPAAESKPKSAETEEAEDDDEIDTEEAPTPATKARKRKATDDANQSSPKKEQMASSWECACGITHVPYHYLCFKCKSKNPNPRPAPLPAGTEIRPEDWYCPNCGTINFKDRNECFKCYTANPKGDVSQNWTCVTCRFSNFISRNNCFKCSKPKSSSPSPGKPMIGNPDFQNSNACSRCNGANGNQPQKWICVNCNFSNFAYCDKCQCDGVHRGLAGREGYGDRGGFAGRRGFGGRGSRGGH